MKTTFFLYLLLSTTLSCNAQYHINKIKHFTQDIDKNSKLVESIDVYKYYLDKDLPDLYRLGAVTYHSYMLNKKLTKVDLVFEGDRETLVKSYYFDEIGKIFFVSHSQKKYDPPKWQKNTKEISVNITNYLIEGSSVSQLTQSNTNRASIIMEIQKLKKIISKLKINKD